MEKQVRTLGAYQLFSVLILAMTWNFEAAAINPALAVIAAAFPNEPMWKVLFISTSPFITSTLFSILAGRLANRFDKKRIAIVGLALYGISGMAPAFLSNMDMILLARIITGAGVGLILPISAMYVSEYYADKAKDRVMGQMVFVFNLANILISILVGVMVTHGWQWAFYVFGLIFVILVNTIVFCPPSPPQGVAANGTAQQGVSAIPRQAYAMFALMTVLWIAFAYLLLTLATLNAERQIIPMAAIGLILAIPGAANAISALVYPKVARYGAYLVSSGLALVAIGFVTAAYAFTLAPLVIACILVGFGQGILVPNVLSATADRVPVGARDKALGLVQSAVHFGPIAATFLVAGALKIASGDAYTFAYNCAAAAAAVLALGSFANAFMKQRRLG